MRPLPPTHHPASVAPAFPSKETDSPNPRTLILGIGNPTRQDDAVGVVLAEQLQALDLPDVEVRTAQQLTLEMAADWANRQHVLVIDAALCGDPINLVRLTDPPEPAATAHTHHAHPTPLAALAQQLYGRRPELWLCTLRAESCDFGDQLSPSMQERLPTARRMVLHWLETRPQNHQPQPGQDHSPG